MTSIYAASIAYVQRSEFQLVDQALNVLEQARRAQFTDPSPLNARSVELARDAFAQAYLALPPMRVADDVGRSGC